MKNSTIYRLATLAILASACSNGSNGGGQDGSDTGITNSDESGGDGEGGDGDGDGEGDGDGDGDGDGKGTKWDTLAVPDAPPCGGPGDGGGDPDFSYIWVANSPQGTISKINTQTLVEEGRYIVREDQAGSPSRTSVSLTGHVATANRSGGVTKVYATSDACEESNGMPGIQTATDANFLAWDMEECRAWHTPMNYASQRPLAWTPGEWNNSVCGYQDEKLWTSGANAQIEVILLDGDSGMVDETVVIQGVSTGYYGVYGAASDGDGNFWGSQLGGGTLINVSIDDMTYKTWQTPGGGYGMTVDHEGYVWICDYQVSRFDPQNETWKTATTNGSGGCMGDGDKLLWQAGSGGMRAVNRETLLVEKTIVLPEYVHGVSVDFYGYVWGVSMSTAAYRGDPEGLTYDTFTGLTSPYTYSDMTGFALQNAGTPSG